MTDQNGDSGPPNVHKRPRDETESPEEFVGSSNTPDPTEQRPPAVKKQKHGDLPRLYPVSYSNSSRPRRTNVRLPERFHNAVYFCVEYPDGVYIDRYGAPKPEVTVKLPKPMTRIVPDSELHKLTREQRQEQTNLKYERMLAQEHAHQDDDYETEESELSEDDDISSTGSDEQSQSESECCTEDEDDIVVTEDEEDDNDDVDDVEEEDDDVETVEDDEVIDETVILGDTDGEEEEDDESSDEAE